MASTKGEDVFFGLRYHPWIKQIDLLLERCHKLADVSGKCRDGDAASSNLRTFAHEDNVDTRSRDPSRMSIGCLSLCFSHQNCHVQGDIVADQKGGGDLLSMMFTGAFLFRTGTIWSMSVREVPHALRRITRCGGSSRTEPIRYGPLPARP